MNAKQYCEAAKAAIASVEKNLIGADGNLKAQPDLVDDAQVIQDAVDALVANGVVLDPNASKAVAGAVAVLRILG